MMNFFSDEPFGSYSLLKFSTASKLEWRLIGKVDGVLEWKRQ